MNRRSFLPFFGLPLIAICAPMFARYPLAQGPLSVAEVMKRLGLRPGDEINHKYTRVGDGKYQKIASRILHADGSVTELPLQSGARS